jgi:hypothetical protein
MSIAVPSQSRRILPTHQYQLQCRHSPVAYCSRPNIDCSAVAVSSHAAHTNVDCSAHTKMPIAVPSQSRRILLTLMSIAVPSQSRRLLPTHQYQLQCRHSLVAYCSHSNVDCSAVTVSLHVLLALMSISSAHTKMPIAVPSQSRRILLTLMSIAVPSQSRRMLLTL